MGIEVSDGSAKGSIVQGVISEDLVDAVAGACEALDSGAGEVEAQGEGGGCGGG